jgi:CheY-like chemotaxis protein
MNRKPRVLIVEDEAVTSMMIEDVAQGLGCEVVGPASRVREALVLAEESELDAALLDVNLDGQAAYPVADRLAARQIPFVFLTGYGAQALPPSHAARPVLQKPFRVSELARTLAATCGLAPPG